LAIPYSKYWGGAYFSLILVFYNIPPIDNMYYTIKPLNEIFFKGNFIKGVHMENDKDKKHPKANQPDKNTHPPKKDDRPTAKDTDKNKMGSTKDKKGCC
jgi:hypothetical protein